LEVVRGCLQGSSARADSESLTVLSSPVTLPKGAETEKKAANRCGVEKDPGTPRDPEDGLRRGSSNSQRSRFSTQRIFGVWTKAYLCRRMHMLLIKIKKSSVK
jgi:hypothetical protein